MFSRARHIDQLAVDLPASKPVAGPGLLRRWLAAAMEHQARRAEREVAPWIAMFEEIDRRVHERSRSAPADEGPLARPRWTA